MPSALLLRIFYSPADLRRLSRKTKTPKVSALKLLLNTKLKMPFTRLRIRFLRGRRYSIVNPLVGGFVFKKRSLNFVRFFEPTSDKSFSYDQGMIVACAVGMNVDPGFLVTTNL